MQKHNESKRQNVMMLLSKNHSKHTWKPSQQQHQKKDICHILKDTEVKLCHSKIVPNKVSLSYHQCFNVSRVHSLVKAMFPTNPVPEVPLA